jgi:hypothetical protein
VIEARVRTQISDIELDAKVGKVLTDGDYNMLLTGPARVLMPDGRLLCVYLPGVLADLMDDAYDVLHMLRTERTDNRGDASGTERMKRAIRSAPARRSCPRPW